MLVLGLVAALTPAPDPAGTSESTAAIELRWQAPAGCPSGEQTRRLIGQLVPSARASVHASVTIDAVAGGFEGALDLRTKAQQTTRRLQTDDCMVLARAMALVIAVSLDPLAVVETNRNATVPEPEPVDPRPRTAEPEPRPRPRAEPSPSPEEAPFEAGDSVRTEPGTASRRLEGGARLGAGVGGLLLPAAGVGLTLAPFLGTDRLHVRAVAQYWAPQEVAFDPAKDARGELQLVTGGVRVCPQLGWAHVRFALCAGADAGAIFGRGTGRDLVPPRSARGPWVGVVLEPGVTVSVAHHVSLWLALEGVVSLYRPLFAVEGAPQEWTAGGGAVRGLVGVQLHARRHRPRAP